MNGIPRGVKRSVYGIAYAAMALGMALSLTSSAQSAGSVTPYGEGSLADPYRISELGHLIWMGDTVGSSSGKYFMVQNNLDASATTNLNSGAGFAPIGTGGGGTSFLGIFNGNGNVISNLYMARSGENYVGLFGCVGSSGVVKNLGLVGGAVTGNSYVGSLVGWISGGIVSGCYATGLVTGGSHTGGLVGYNEGGTVSGCHTTGPVTGSADYVAGLVAWNEGGTVSDCYATGPVTNLGYFNVVAGLVGANHGTVRNCYAAGSVQAPSGYYVGGIVGGNQAGGTVSNCYATGSVTGSTYVACLVGYNDGLLSKCYATGPVAGSSSVGGLVGLNNLGTVSSSYWDTQTSGRLTSAGGSGTNTAAMKRQATFAGWDFTNVWHMTENVTYPFFTFSAIEPPGAGTAGDPYLISQLGHLVWMGDTVGSSGGKRYVLQNDLDASATTNWNSGAGFAPIGIGNQYGQPLRPFMGVFDGNGKVISHLTILRPDQGGVGLFGYMGSGGKVMNVGLTGGSVSGYYYVGGLVGLNNDGMVSNCYATCPVTGSSTVGGLMGCNGSYGHVGTVSGCHATGPVKGDGSVGGLVGANYFGDVTRCFATGSVMGTGNQVGGLVGYNEGTVSRCYASGPASGVFYIGGLVGYNQELATVSDSYARGSATAENAVGGLVGYNYGGTMSRCYATGPATSAGWPWVGGLLGWWWGSIGLIDSYWDTETSGLTGSAGGTGTNTVAMKQQATFAGWDFTNVWQITEGVTYPFFRATTVIPPGAGTAADPYLISELGNLVWMGANVGSSSGKYYTVQNDIDASATVGWESGAGFAPIGSSGQPFMGSFNGQGKVIIGLSINRLDQNTLGLFGYVGSSGVVMNLGLEGGSMLGGYNVGGLIGYNSGGTVSDCYVMCPVTGEYGHVGGLVGWNVGGTIHRCYATGSVTAGNGSHVGGLVGRNSSGALNGCHASGAVMGFYAYEGGLVGYNESSTISNCYASGSVSSSRGDAGGLVGGNMSSSISGCYATGAVTGPDDVGGLVGYNDGAVSGCFATGAVLLSNSYGGGLVGLNSGPVNQCYATGAVTGPYAVGGLIGQSSGPVSECYAVGLVTKTVSYSYPTGGLVANIGGAGGAVNNCYWDTNATGQAASAGGGTGVDTAAMKQQATFAGWDFTGVWGVTENVTYPYLRPVAVMPLGAGTSADPYQISEPAHLVWMGDHVGTSSGKYYTVQNDIDASTTTNLNGGAGLAPIGSNGLPFLGVFDGNGKTISNLLINRPLQTEVGLFGFVEVGGVVQNLVLEGSTLAGYSYVGGIVGWNRGTVNKCYVTGSVTAHTVAGGVVGINQGGAIRGCHAIVAVTAVNLVGGLVGDNSGSLDRCSATGTVTGGSRAGGLLGANNSGTVNGCYATGPVRGDSYIGGLVGRNNVGSVNGCYATGWVTGLGNVGGLVGYNVATVSNSYWDVQNSGLANSAGGMGTNTAAMLQQATYAGWDFVNVWQITENVTYPWLAPFVIPVAKIIGVSGNLAFGSVTTGQTAMATLTITNSGDAMLTVASITYPAGFSGAWSGAIVAGGSQQVIVTFAPVAVTAYGGMVTVNSDATSGTNTLAASGSGQAVVRLTGLANPASGGRVTGGGVYVVGSNATLLATASNGWLFVYWNDGGSANPRTLTMPNHDVSCTATFVSAATSLALGTALNATGLVWQTGGNANWAVQSATTHDGVAALKSGAIGTGQQTWFQTTTIGPGSLMFWWKASSAPTNYLQFYINTQLVSQISGNVGWNQYVGYIGTSNQITLKWVYTKNGAAGAGSDAGWVDQINWMPCPYVEHVPLIFYQDPTGMLASWVIGTNASFQFARILANTGGWALKCVGDVDGDTVSDLLFQNAAGDAAGWFMNANGSTRSARFWFNLSGWEIKACGDYEGIGRGQLFFQNTAGVAAYWRIDTNGNYQAAIPLGAMGGWKLRGIGEMDGDGKAELFWQNAAGTVVIWYHNANGTIRGGTPFNTGDWALCGVADIDGDGVSDLVWQNSAGLTGGWFMNSNGAARAASFWWGTGTWKLKAAGR